MKVKAVLTEVLHVLIYGLTINDDDEWCAVNKLRCVLRETLPLEEAERPLLLLVASHLLVVWHGTSALTHLPEQRDGRVQRCL